MNILKMHRIILLIGLISCPLWGHAQNGWVWSQMSSGSTATLHDISVLDSGYAVTVGTNSTVLVYDGDGWTEFTGAADRWGAGATLRSVDVVSSDDIWVGSTANASNLAHWDGENWNGLYSTQNHSAHTIWHSSADNILVGGSNSRMSRRSGEGTWTRPLNAGGGPFTAIHGTGVDNIWAVNSDNKVYKSINGGASWVAQSSVPLLSDAANPRLNAVYVLAEDSVWIAGDRRWEIAHWNGVEYTLWQLGDSGGLGFQDIYALDDNNVWAVGSSGAVFFYDGEGWSQVSHGLVSSTLRSIDMDDTGRLFVVGDDGVILQAAMPEPAVITGISSVLLLIFGSSLRKKFAK